MPLHLSPQKKAQEQRSGSGVEYDYKKQSLRKDAVVCIRNNITPRRIQGAVG